jgi:hypothetical protein
VNNDKEFLSSLSNLGGATMKNMKRFLFAILIEVNGDVGEKFPNIFSGSSLSQGSCCPPAMVDDYLISGS